MFDCDDYLTSESDDGLPPNLIYDRYQSGDGYHAVPPPYTGTFMPPKPDLVFHNAHNVVKTVHIAFNVELSPTKPDNDLSHTHRPSTPIIEDWVSNLEDESETKLPQNTAIPKPTRNGNCKNRKACFVCQSLDYLIKDWKMGMKTKMSNLRPRFPQYKCINNPQKGNPQYALKDKGVIDSGCSRHITGNMSCLSDFEELNGGYVAFGGNLKGGKIFGKDDDQVLLRVPRENNMYNVNLKNIVPSEDLTCLFVKATLDESNLWHRRLGHINFKTMNKLVKGLENQLSLKNTDGDAAFDEKEPEFEERKPKSEVNVSPSSSAQSKKHDDKTKREAKGKKLEDITYSDDEDDVGAEADFTNFETSITVSPVPTTRVHKDHPVTQIIGDLSSATQTRSMTGVAKDQCGLSQINNDDFHTFARIEAIRLFLAYASFMGFMVYQMDVKSAFLYGTIDEEVYVCQPPGFEDPDYPDKVYKVVKALYGLHQAPRDWYETLANYLLENGFQRGKIDQTLFIKRQKSDILLVQIYVDDIIFSLTNKDLCKAFEKLMKDKFQIISMGELTFFLGLQVKQKKDGIFISQDKYVAEILKKFGLTDGKSTSTPIDIKKPLLKDPDGEDVDMHTYRSMIGSLMYLTSSRPDIMFAVSACAHFQVTPKASHLHAVKRKNRVLVTKPQNKTPYELLHGRTSSIGFMRPFGYPVTILNTLDSLGKFDRKVDEGFLVGCSISSKAFRVFNSRTQIIQETLRVIFLENKPNVVGSGLTGLFDIDTLTKTMNYQPVIASNQSNHSAGVQEQFDAEKAGEENVHQYVLFPVWSSGFKNPQNTDGDASFDEKEPEFEGRKPESEINVSPSKFEDLANNHINEDNAGGTLVPTVGQFSLNSNNTFSAAGPSNVAASPTHGKSLCIDTSQYPDDPNMPELEDITYSDDEKDEEGIDYEEVFAPVVRMEAIRLFLAYASFMGFMVYQMDVKSAFMYGTIEEEKGDILLVQIYVDDIIFGSTIKDFLTNGKSASTPVDTEKPLLKDPDGEDVDMHTYRSIIGSLMYLTLSRPDIMFPVCVVLCGMVSLKRMLHVTNILSDGYPTTLQMVLNSPCLTHIKNWLVQIKRSLANEVTRLQALVYKKKVIILEATIRDALHLDDAEGIESLPNEGIFVELARMGYEKPFTKLTFYKAF
nr:putative ribonuclease H-like domain-containing protein [Tanacetum cinerariifolium]